MLRTRVVMQASRRHHLPGDGSGLYYSALLNSSYWWQASGPPLQFAVEVNAVDLDR